MASRQVRLDADVAEILEAKARGNGRSVAYEANRALRQALALPIEPGETPDPPVRAGAVAMAAPSRRFAR